MNAGIRSPRILIDGLFFQMARTGIARVWTSLLREWVANGFAEHLVFLNRGDSAPRIDGVRYRAIPIFDYDSASEDAIRLQSLCDEERADLFVSTYYTTPLTTPSVFLAYDMIPEVYGKDEGPMWREKHYGLLHASAHVAVSRNTARDLLRFFPEVRSDSVTVAYPGVDATFHPATACEMEHFRERYRVRKPYFLLVGCGTVLNGYKNAVLFFNAFADLADRQRFAVVCTGDEAALDPAVRPLGGDAAIQWLYVSDEELRAAYSGAVALVFPSRYEGFGLPVLEAMACGCPVITCRNSSLLEVAGEAALFVPESDPNAMVATLQRVQEDVTRQTLIAAGLLQAAKFSWRETAATLESVMRRTALEGRPSRIWREFRQLQTTTQEPPWKRDEREKRELKTEQDLEESRAALNVTRDALRRTQNALEQSERELSELKARLANLGVAAPPRRG